MARTFAGAAQGRTNRRFLLIALLLAGLSLVLVYATISRQDSGDGGSAPADVTQVVVAKEAIPERTRITEDMLELKNVPINSIVDGAYVSVADAVGKVTKLPIARNAQVVQTSVVDTTGSLADSLELVVPTDQRAMSITASQVLSAGGLILPGDFVDIVWTCCGGTPTVARTLLQNVQVAAVDQAIVNAGPPGDDGTVVSAGDGEANPEAVTLTLLLTPEQGQQVFLAEQQGSLRAELRGPEDKNLPLTGFTKITDILPVDAVADLPDDLKPDGYKEE
jgi:pilus assembly protein CpaB